ncbi:type II toxin-antitoxin system HicB family antitoxin [Desulfovibrio sp. UCD-KL4C]|uniref:type II toxin-antitoxin system HicB family antitoxin n=1 Tax=Desulfovibrio sp. UCD-KL4C TaxID=2578120 RepID=UPI0025BB7618|nr:type II toxin-antitoxin system HicB family antitoxin [Desulfovibrio sp. UCD-KL4C]
MKYVAILHIDDAGYGITLPDFPGAFSSADTLDEVLADVQTIVELWFEGEPDKELPSPTEAKDLVNHPDLEGGILTLIDVDLSFLNKKAARINISVPKYLLLKIDKAAEKANMNRSAYLVESALKRAEKSL